jgi:very-short-patch-repair endonuclease
MRPPILRARLFRSAMSTTEVIMWSRLQRLRERGFHFRRQAPFRGYFLDFVCYRRRLVIEVDGRQHGDDRQADHDLVRDRILMREGFVVLRFSASAVVRDADSVMEQVIAALEVAGDTREGKGDHRPAPSLGRGSPP